MIRNIFTGLLFKSESDEVLLPVGSGMPVLDYRAQFGHIKVGEKRGNAGNQAVADYRRKLKYCAA